MFFLLLLFFFIVNKTDIRCLQDELNSVREKLWIKKSNIKIGFDAELDNTAKYKFPYVFPFAL